MPIKSNKTIKKLALSYPVNNGEIMLEDIIDRNLRSRQLKIFQDNILNKKNPNQFDVYDFEPAWGKTTEAKKILIEYKEKNPNKRVLWLTNKKEDCKQLAKDINELFHKKVAKAIIGGTGGRKERKKILEKYDIVIATHERYRRLCRFNNIEKSEFTNDRHLLIIDEHIDMCKTVSFSTSSDAKLRHKLVNLVGNELAKKYDTVVKELKDYLKDKNWEKIYNKGLVFETQSNLEEIEINIDALVSYIEQNIEYAKELKSFNYDNEKKQTVIEQLEDLREFYTNTSIIVDYDHEKDEVVLKVPNNSLKMWGLEYNLILDATASIDKSYSYDKIFNIIYQDRIYDHKNWTVLWANINSTKYGRKTYINFTEAVNQIITDYLGEDNTFTMCNKENDITEADGEEFKLHKYKGKTEHYGNTNGSNEFEECKNFINTDLNYVDNSYYAIKYIYYSKKKIYSWSSGGGKFNNRELEAFKTYEVAKSHCQAIKRINRRMKYGSTIIFLCHREDIKYLTFQTLKGCNIIHCKEIEQLFIKSNPTKIEKFMELCTQILDTGKLPKEIKKVLKKEEYKKYEDCNNTFKIPKIVFALAIDSGGNAKKISNSFGTFILKDKKVIEFLKENKIKISNKSIDFSIKD